MDLDELGRANVMVDNVAENSEWSYDDRYDQKVLILGGERYQNWRLAHQL